MDATQNFNLTEAEYSRLQQGEQRLQTRIFDKYAPAFTALARSRYAINVEDAEEIVSSAFAKLFYKVLMGDVQRDNLQGYVYTIVKHKCLEKAEQYKKNILENRETIPEMTEEETENEWLPRLNLAFEKLGEKCQQLLSRFYFDEEDHSLIATSLGITEEASRQRKRECMKKLRKLVC